MRRLLLLFVLLLGPVRLSAQLGGVAIPQIKGDEFAGDLEAGVLVYRGNARLQVGDATLTANEFRYHLRERTVQATCNVVLTQGARRLLATQLTYHLDSRRYQAQDLRLGQLPLYVSGTLLEGSTETLTFDNAAVTYGEPGHWAPTLVADRITFHPERERLRAEGASLGLGLLQPLPVPNVELPTNFSFLSFLSLNAGYNSSLGAFLVAGVHLPVGAGVDLGGEVGYFTERGLLFGPSGTYARGRGTDREMIGEFRTGFIHDNGEKLVDLLGDPVPEDRGFVQWTHRQQWGERLTLGAMLNYWSDSEVLRDFRPDEFFPIQTPDTFAEITHVTPNTVLALFARAQPNHYHRVRERLPELSFALLPTPLAHGVYHEAQTSVAILRDDPPDGSVGLRSDRVDGYYALTRPFTPREWLTIKPVAGARVTHYARALGGRSDYTRALGEFGVDTELRASGTFAYKNERWGIDGLRHLITPRISYRYIPDATRGTPYIPAVDRRVFATYLDPLGLGARRQIDDLAATNTLRISLDNRLQTRDATYGSRDLIALNIAADVRFDDAYDRTLSDLHTEVRLMPAPWLAFDLYHRLTPGTGQTQELNAALTLRDADRWRLRLANHFLANEIQEHVLGFAYRLNEVYEVFVRAHYDARRGRFNEQSYGVNQVLGNRWVIGYEFSFFEGRRRESNFGFNLLLEALSF